MEIGNLIFYPAPEWSWKEGRSVKDCSSQVGEDESRPLRHLIVSGEFVGPSSGILREMQALKGQIKPIKHPVFGAFEALVEYVELKTEGKRIVYRIELSVYGK